MGIVPRDPDRPSSPPNHILGRNGEETAKTRTQRAQTAIEIPIPRQVALLVDPKPARSARSQTLADSGREIVYSRGGPLVARGRFELPSTGPKPVIDRACWSLASPLHHRA